MKTIKAKFVAAAAMIVEIKKGTDLLIVRITNLKTYAAVEAIIIGMAN